MASLFVIQGRDQGRRFEFDQGELSIGRDGVNRVQLRDTEVSRCHASMTKNRGGYCLIDSGSSNGTYVNSHRVDRHVLRSGDRVQMGQTLMIFTGEEASEATDTCSSVDIVGRDENESQIVSSVSQDEGSRLLSELGPTDSPWLSRARSNLQVMYRTALAVSHTLDIDQLLDRIMELIFEWVEADRGCIMLIERSSDKIVPKVHRNRGSRTTRMEISRTILDYVQQNQEGVLTSDAREDARWGSAASIVKMGIREAICVPMQGRYGTVGVIYVDTFTSPALVVQQQARNRFNDEHLKLMVAIGHQAALAIEDTAYYSAMVQAERLAAIGQTIAGLSHHVKNILQGIRGGSYLIEEGLKAEDAETTRKGWRIVEKNQERISSLVMDMLTFSKERQPEMSPNNINEVVRDVVELARPRATEESVQLDIELSDAIGEMTFDGEALHRAILNLITNAIDACEGMSGAQVTVTTDYLLEENLLKVMVADNGKGISEDALPRIFTVFESDKGKRGTGLGLPVSQKILREHNGDILVESVLGEGSCFTLKWPAVQPDMTKGLDISGKSL